MLAEDPKQIEGGSSHFRAYKIEVKVIGVWQLLGGVVAIGGNCFHPGACGTGNISRNRPNSMADMPPGLTLKVQWEYWWLDTSRYADLRGSSAHLKISTPGDAHWPASFTSLSTAAKNALSGLSDTSNQAFNMGRQPVWLDSCDLVDNANLCLYRPGDEDGNFSPGGSPPPSMLYLQFNDSIANSGRLSRVEWWRGDGTTNNRWGGNTHYLVRTSAGDLQTGDGDNLRGNFAKALV